MVLRLPPCFLASALWASSMLTLVLATEKELYFESDVRPILKLHCFQCHGEESKPESDLDLRLARWMLKGGKSGTAVVEGDALNSLLWQRIESGEMPPKGKGLSDQEKKTLRTWIEQGARTKREEPENLESSNYWTEEERNYWAFHSPVRPPQPKVNSHEDAATPLDPFLLVKLEDAGFTFSQAANRRTLARRLSFDLHGLPPDPMELEKFEMDTSPDAYDRLVDRMLASPAYGERWARHWLDIAGYADSDGYSEKDAVRPWSFRYRDYVIRSMNESKPLDLWIMEQLAGDEMISQPLEDPPDDVVEKLTATGFLRMAPDGTEDGGDAKVARNDVVAETLKIVSTSMMGLTVGCAQCHDHRYDPISQVDYYRMRAIFEPALDPSNWRNKSSRTVSILPRQDRELAAKVDAALKELDDRQRAELNCIVEEIFEREVDKLPEDLRQRAVVARETQSDKRSPEQRQLMKDHPSLNVDRGSAYLYEPGRLNDFNKRWDKLKSEKRSERPADQAVACITEVPGQVPKTFVFFRGDLNQPKESVEPGDLSVFPVPAKIPVDDEYVPTTGRRLALARHLTSGKHPLLGRVLVNRIWMHMFGKGIVDTPADFGALGDRPSHPELLDWLAVELVDSGWDMKRLHRLIVTSNVYRQASFRTEALNALDPDNRLLGRMAVRRLEAEAIRDAMIEVAGMRTMTMYGPPAPVNPDDVGQFIVGSATRDGNGIMIAKLNDDPEQYRRSIYVQVRRSMPLGMLEPFDLATLAPNCEKRSASTVTPQSLFLMNNQVTLQLAERFAKRLIHEIGEEDVQQQVKRATELAFGIALSNEDIPAALQFVRAQREYFVSLRVAEDAAPKKESEKSKSASEATESLPVLTPHEQALALFCQALISSNQFLYVE